MNLINLKYLDLCGKRQNEMNEKKLADRVKRLHTC